MHEIFKFCCSSGQEESRDKFQYPLEMKADLLGTLKDHCWDILVLQRIITLLNKNNKNMTSVALMLMLFSCCKGLASNFRRKT